MQQQDPEASRAQLSRLVGSWIGEERMPPSQWSPEELVAEGWTSGREGLGGFGVIVDYEQRNGGQVTFTGHGVYQWDPEAEEVVLHWFDAVGAGRDEFRGKWDGDVLTMRTENAMGHWRSTYDYSTPGELVTTMEVGKTPDELRLMHSGRYRAE